MAASAADGRFLPVAALAGPNGTRIIATSSGRREMNSSWDSTKLLTKRGWRVSPETDIERDLELEELLSKAYSCLGRETSRIHLSERVTASGRNDPCPCGSQKKVKKCCLSSASQVALTARRRVNQLAGVLHNGAYPEKPKITPAQVLGFARYLSFSSYSE